MFEIDACASPVSLLNARPGHSLWALRPMPNPESLGRQRYIARQYLRVLASDEGGDVLGEGLAL